jgi:lysozyme
MNFIQKIIDFFRGKKPTTTTPPVVAGPIVIIPPKSQESTNLDSLDAPWKDSNTCIVIDAYEKNSIDWAKMSEDKKMVGVIHRSSIGMTVDQKYKERKKIALEKGYLWGAYHLGKRGNTIAQADLFLSLIGNDFSTMMALDLEDTSNASMMTIDEAVVFMNHVYQKTGRICVVYANHSVTIALNAKLKTNFLFQNSKLWYARFKSKITDFPVGIWKNYFLWQFSSEINCSRTGTCLYNVPGTSSDMDINVFSGSVQELKARWANEIVQTQKPVFSEVQTTTPWFDIAKGEIGQKEISGSAHNKRILDYHAATSLKATNDETPWCSSFVSYCLEKAGIASTKNAWARSYLAWGKKIDVPVKGCIVVFSRGDSSGHVAFFESIDGNDIKVLGGNQGNEVCYDTYPKSRLLGYRLPN